MEVGTSSHPYHRDPQGSNRRSGSLVSQQDGLQNPSLIGPICTLTSLTRGPVRVSGKTGVGWKGLEILSGHLRAHSTLLFPSLKTDPGIRRRVSPPSPRESQGPLAEGDLSQSLLSFFPEFNFHFYTQVCPTETLKSLSNSLSGVPSSLVFSLVQTTNQNNI